LPVLKRSFIQPTEKRHFLRPTGSNDNRVDSEKEQRGQKRREGAWSIRRRRRRRRRRSRRGE
jgi:hypothetical protein